MEQAFNAAEACLLSEKDGNDDNIIQSSVKGPDNVDRVIGEKITLLRTTMGITRQKLAKELGITHQQLHKYEKGKNRIPVSRLVAIARILNIDILFFFDNLIESALPQQFDLQRSCMQLMRDFINIEKEEHRNAVRSLIRTLARTDK